LQRLGHDARHTAQLPAGNNNTDYELNQLSVSGQCKVIS